MEITQRRLTAVAAAILVAACSRSSETPAPATLLQIQPPAADVAPADVVSFAAFRGAAREPVTWTVQEAGGGVVDESGSYTAPAAEGTFHVVASAGANDTASAIVVVRRRPASAVTVTIVPKAASVAAGATLAFSASVSGTANGAVTWSVEEGAAGGSITAAGLYAAAQSPGTYHVVARSAGDPSQLDRAAVTVVGAVDPPPGPQLYVSPNGNDSSPGTLAQPWRTIQKAMSAATPGSIVNIRTGTYQERLVMNVSGTAGNPITFQPYGFVGSSSCGGRTGNTCPGERVVVDYSHLGTNTSTTPLLRVSGKQHLVIQGIVFQNFACTGAMQQGIRVDGASSGIKFRWLRIANWRNVHEPGFDGTTALLAARVWGPSDDVQWYACEFDTIKTNMSEVLTYDQGATNALVERSYFHDTDGIALSTFNGANRFAFRDNRFAWCGLKRDGSFWYNNPAVALYNDGGYDGVFEGNILTDGAVGIESMPESAHFGNPEQPAAHDIVIRNNIVVRHRETGMVVGTWYSSTDGSGVYNHDIYNNVIYDSNLGFLVRPFDAATTRIRNNIVAGCTTAYYNGVGWNVGTSFDYNLYAGGGSGPDAHEVVADPRFANPAAEDFSLLAGSPAMDAGDPATTTVSAGASDFLGLPRLVGGRIDMGAVERQ